MESNNGTTAITGNTYPVKEQLKALGGRWNPDAKAWMVPARNADAARKLVTGGHSHSASSYRPHKCCTCGHEATRYNPIYRNGECRECYRDRKDEESIGY